MDFAAKKKSDGKFTVKDYVTWPDDERWEIIGGEAYDMTPAPTPRHQTIVVNFGSLFKTALKGASCRVFIAPTDVVFSEYDVVQPDVFVVCDEKKITAANIQGAPDLVVEVLSPSTSIKDKRDKKALYERFGVREYIIAYPEDLFIERYRLVDGKFGEADVVGAQENVTLAFVDGVEIPLWEVFETAQPENNVQTA
ncbi:MAG: hypothetical protein A2X57_11945 [Nitrospirae bacterium GWD2_57_8]|nr:MAG: hypothetical protein A2X57_11945 [Nitrospirae bacterium GWD2_57_8]